MQHIKYDSLKTYRRQLEKEIAAKYPTVEKFCFENDLPKSTVSRLLKGRTHLRIETLQRIAKAVGRKVEIRLK